MAWKELNQKKKKKTEQSLLRTRQAASFLKFVKKILELWTDVHLRLSENHIRFYSNMGIERPHMDSYGHLILCDLWCG